MIKKVYKTVSWSYIISDLNGKEAVGNLYKEQLQKPIKKEFRIEKVIKRNGNKLYAK